MQQIIRLRGDHFDKVLRGASAVVRLSNKTPELGEAVFFCENVPPHHLPIIIERVTILPFEALNPFDIGKTKFKTSRHLREGLELFYDRKIHPRQTVRLIEFFIDKDKASDVN